MTDDSFTDRYLIQTRVVENEFVTRSIAVDRILGRQVLVTQLKGRIGRRAATQQRFRSSAEQAARLSHHNVIALFDVSSANGLPYAIQEYSLSEPLSEIIAHEGPFHPDDVAILVEQIADALDYADQRGLNHHALRPENVVVDYDGIVLVSDFGIGVVLDELGEISLLAARYRAPELANSNGGDHRSDVFSLGVIAYQMLTGKVPFEAESKDLLVEQMQRSALIAPSVANPDVPPAISGVVLAAISSTPQNRFQSAGEFAYALSNWRDAQIDPRTLRIGSSGPTSTRSFNPLAGTGLIAINDQIVDDDEPEIGTNRLTPILAWAAVAVGVIAIAWIGLNLLDSRANDANPDITRIAQSTSINDASQNVSATPSDADLPTAASLIGSSVEEAEGITDLAVRVVSTETSDTVPAGQIIRQSPNPGNPVRNNEFLVVVSSGAGPLDLSSIDAANVRFDQLADTLTSMGLNVVQSDEGSPTIAEGLVIRIEQTIAEPGDEVTIVVSKGDKVQIPLELESRPLDEVIDLLQALGLDVGDPRAVSESRINDFGVQLAERDIVDGDVVGIQESEAVFGNWVENGSTVTPVYYDADLDP